ncbi:MAG: thioredoxin family protein [Gammaproteobacteria bacterium]|nr:thioredoxin family protein [Gammaproteobacteria bacterium]MDH5727583.1 thioredoxin family protein [Gammaproteobacteria bacterium]
MQLTKTTKLLLILLVVSIAISFAGLQLSRFSSDASLSHWHQGFEGFVEASRLQAETGKPMALFFYTDWCPNCKKLREEVLSSPQVNDFLNQLHLVKINPELGSYENKLAEEFKVQGYPTFLVVEAETGEAKSVRRTSNITAEQFVNQLTALM